MTSLARKPHTSYRTFKSVKFETPSNSHDPQLPRNEPESYVTHSMDYIPIQETSYDVQDIKYDQHLQLTPRKLHHHSYYRLYYRYIYIYITYSYPNTTFI